MSKPKPPPARPGAWQPLIPPGSTAASILAEKVKVRLEIIARQEYQDLLKLRAELAALPPIPPSPVSPTSED